MIIGVIFKNGKEIDRGILTGGKKYSKEDPEQYIFIADETSAYDVVNERKYTHDGTITFQELQDNGNGWEVVYDSNEGVDRTVYNTEPIPSWFYDTSKPIPNYHHRINEDGEKESEFRGYVQ